MNPASYFRKCTCYLSSESFHHRLPYRTDLIVPVVFLITPRHGPRRKHRSSFAVQLFLLNCCLLRICCLTTDVALLFRGRCLQTGVYATISLITVSVRWMDSDRKERRRGLFVVSKYSHWEREVNDIILWNPMSWPRFESGKSQIQVKFVITCPNPSSWV
jgi:hypothetical protein